MKKVQIKSKSRINVLTTCCYNGTSTAQLFLGPIATFVHLLFYSLLACANSYALVSYNKNARNYYNSVFLLDNYQTSLFRTHFCGFTTFSGLSRM